MTGHRETRTDGHGALDTDCRPPSVSDAPCASPGGLSSIESCTVERATLYHCDHVTLARAMLADGLRAHAVLVDAPYSAKTHAGHNDGTSQVEQARDWASRAPEHMARMARSVLARVERGAWRRAISYPAWGQSDVQRFAQAWSPLCGWLVSITDHALAPVWDSELSDVGRYTFSPIACVEPGSRARFTGDGPPQWSTWAIVSRPRSREWLTAWHALRREHGMCPRGAYVVPSGSGDGDKSERVPGAKPLWLMRAMVTDYTAPGQLVCDPCAGSATTLIAAAQLGRDAIGCEPDRETYEASCRRMWRRLRQRDLFASGGER